MGRGYGDPWRSCTGIEIPALARDGFVGVIEAVRTLRSISSSDGGAVAMSLRKVLGADVDRVHEQVDALLDSEDAMIVLVDGSRAINYAQGFGISPSQLELLALEIERAVRNRK